MINLKASYKFCFASLAIFLFISGCAPHKATIKEEEEDKFAEELRKHERTFDPTEYNEPFELTDDDISARRPEPHIISDDGDSDSPEYTQGFRIQLFSSTDIESAQEVYESADLLFKEEWIYIIYEVPYYKVRLGNFESRPYANRALAEVIRKGFRDAWVVPDRVIQDPPEKEDQNKEISTENN